MITTEYVQFVTAREFGVHVETMRSKMKDFKHTRPRQVAMMLSWEFGKRSLPAIGARFKRDHTCVLNAKRRIPFLMQNDSILANRVQRLRTELAGVENSHESYAMEKAAAERIGAFLRHNEACGFDSDYELKKIARSWRRRRIVARHTAHE